MFLGVIYGILFWAATLILVVGVALRIRLYWNTPTPLKIPTMPAPRTQGGVVWRLFKEAFFFQSLFRSDKVLWLLGIVFHYSLLLAVFRHMRYFQDPVWDIFVFMQPFGKYASFLMIVGLSGLLARRFLIDRVRYISSPSDYLMLVLFLVIAVSGTMMTFVLHADIISIKAFFRGLIYFNWQPMPADPILLVHLTSVALLMIIFPISKLMHAPGIFFSPTRNQIDNSREVRHVAPWAAELDKQGVDYLSELKK